MKRFSIFLIAITALFTTVSCGNLFKSSDTNSGEPFSVVVVCENKVWVSQLGEELRKIVEQPIEMLKENEKSFDIIHLTPDEFSDVYKPHRNILKVVCSSDVKQSELVAQRNVYTTPQSIITLRGNSIEDMTNYLKENSVYLMAELESTERERTLNAARNSGSKAVEYAINQQFGINMLVSNGYTVRNQIDNFIWASNEYPKASQGFFIYTHPFVPQDKLSVRSLVNARNNAARLIPGPAENSYMTTVTKIPDLENNRYVEFLPQRKVLEINGRQWVELRGFWEVEGDFMGGPFVSYTTLDERINKLITIDFYLYAPVEKNGQRKLFRWLEHLIYGVTIPTEE
jgi:hypothetical protein